MLKVKPEVYWLFDDDSQCHIQGFPSRFKPIAWRIHQLDEWNYDITEAPYV